MKICIVGGGTAGWLAAMFISKIKPEHEVFLIESSAVGIVGAGEGSTGSLTDVISNRLFDFGCNEIDFFRETGATLKFGIMHRHWTPDKTQYFGPLDGSPTAGSPIDYCFAHAVVNMGDKAHLISDLGKIMHHSYSNFSKERFQFMRSSTIGNALHFDAFKVGQYFKKISLTTGRVTCIDDQVSDISMLENGMIESVSLSDGRIIAADFFIDASGFSRLLVKKLGINWKSYSKNLPVNSAMPFILDYKEGEIPEPYTTAWAHSSGWMWRIPQQNKIGCGYVFCDDFITAEKAQEEIEQSLNRSIDPIRILKFDTGRLENTWNKNCLAIGLCAAFAEPLEATSIHSTIVQLYSFVYEFLKPNLNSTINPASIKIYNKRTNRMYDDYKDFLVMHYMGGRKDTDFWRFISSGETRTEMVNDIIETAKTRLPTKNDIPNYFGSAGWGLWSFVLAGLKKINKDVCEDELTLSVLNNQSLKSLALEAIIDQDTKFNSAKKEFMTLENFYRFIKTK